MILVQLASFFLFLLPKSWEQNWQLNKTSKRAKKVRWRGWFSLTRSLMNYVCKPAQRRLTMISTTRHMSGKNIFQQKIGRLWCNPTWKYIYLYSYIAHTVSWGNINVIYTTFNPMSDLNKSLRLNFTKLFEEQSLAIRLFSQEHAKPSL